MMGALAAAAGRCRVDCFGSGSGSMLPMAAPGDHHDHAVKSQPEESSMTVSQCCQTATPMTPRIGVFVRNEEIKFRKATRKLLRGAQELSCCSAEADARGTVALTGGSCRSEKKQLSSCRQSRSLRTASSSQHWHSRTAAAQLSLPCSTHCQWVCTRTCCARRSCSCQLQLTAGLCARAAPGACRSRHQRRRCPGRRA